MDMLNQALDVEEGNTFDHKHYLASEEAKRRRAKAVRLGIEGPKLRWISQIEDETQTTADDVMSHEYAEGHNFKRKCSKNYVHIDFGLSNAEEGHHLRKEGSSTWSITMGSLFGQQTDWDTARVLTGKYRPIGK